ncbi:MAG: MarR family winged helix-turn-helix transcriptional regulator [Bacteroidota bacterium]
MNSKQPNPYVKKSEISGFIIERTAKRMKQRFKRMLKEAKVGVTVDQWIILQLLDQRDGLSQFEIASDTFKDAPTVTRIIDLLCKKDLCERVADQKDRRKFNIHLTKKGKEKVVEVKPITKDFRKIGWNGLSDEDINEMSRILNVIFNNLA